MASSDLKEPLGPCPTPFQHLLIRGVLVAATVYERAGSFQNDFSPSSDLYSVVLWSYVINSAQALQTLGQQLQFSNLAVAPALLRLEVECLISALWIMATAPTERNKRLARVIRKGVVEHDHFAASTSQVGNVQAQVALAYLHTQELQEYQNEKPAPSVRQMSEDVGRPELYSAYRNWSGQMHAGFGMHIREVIGDARLNRIEHLLVGSEYLYGLLEALGPTIPREQQQRYQSILGTFRLEYLERLQDAFFSALAATSAHDLPEDQQQQAIASICQRFRPDIGASSDRLPSVIVTDVVRGKWGKRFECISVRFRNIGEEPVALRARLREEKGRSWRRWLRRWRLSCEDVHSLPPLRLLPDESGYLIFPGSVRKDRSIELDSGEQVGRVDVFPRPFAALQNVVSDCIEIVTVRTHYTGTVSGTERTVLQPIVVA